MGIDRVVTVEVHNVVAFQNAFRCRTEHLEARRLLAEHLAPQLRDHPVAVMSPDVGGVKRAERFRQTLGRLLAEDPPLVFMEKHRDMGVMSGEALVGEVADRAVIIYDDLISTGGTVMRAARACREQGAGQVIAAAAHGLFTGEADELLADPALDELVISSTVPPFRLESEAVRRKLTVVDVAPVVAESIKRIHGGGSIVELLDV
jgi:ribose-phosphate pyrophosphokinase